MGVELGSRLLPSLDGINEKGFWEDIDLNQLNVEMLQALDTDWHYLSPPGRDFVDSLRDRGFLLRAVDLLRQKVGDCACFGFKDPRVTQLLPFWKEVFAHCDFDLGYVLAIRNPISVAKSLMHRDSFDFEKSTLLWLGHTVEMLEGTAGAERRVIVDYDQLIQAPQRELTRIAAALHLEIDSKEMQTYKSEFLDKTLRHTIYDLEDLTLDAFTASLTRDLYPLLLAAASDKIEIDAPKLQKEIVNSRKVLNHWKYPLRLIDSLYAFKRSTVQEFARRDARLEDVQRALDETINQLNVARNSLHDRDGTIGALNGVVAERSSQIGHLQEILLERDEQIDSLTRSDAVHEHRVAELTRSQADKNNEIEDLNRRALLLDEDLERANLTATALQAAAAKQLDLLESRDRQIAVLEQSITLKDADFATEKALLAASELKIADLNLHIIGWETKVCDQRAQIESRDGQITTLEGDIALKGAAVASNESLLAASQLTITDLNSSTVGLEAKVSEQQALIESRDIQISALEGTIVLKDGALATNDKLLAASELRIADLNLKIAARLREIQSLIAAATPQAARINGYAGFPELSALLAQNGAQFVESAFRSIVGRKPDAESEAYFRDQIQSGAPKLKVLGDLLNSAEARSRKVSIAGLRWAVVMYRFAQIPLLGNLVANSSEIERDTASARRIRAVELQLMGNSSRINAQFDRLWQEISSMQHLLARQCTNID
jgi:hypothetical protein